MKAARIIFAFVISFAVLPQAYALSSPDNESQKPVVQYDDTDIAPPVPDTPDSTDPLFEDSDAITDLPEPDSYGEEPLQNDGVLPDDTDPGEINPAE